VFQFIRSLEKKKESRMALPQLDESKMKLVQELEIEMMTDMYARWVSGFLIPEYL
jgi:hypothetical protein